jgi:hypothetical protein
MSKGSRKSAAGIVFAAVALHAQRRVDPKNSFFRVIAVVPLVISGASGAAAWPKHVPTGVRASEIAATAKQAG